MNLLLKRRLTSIKVKSNNYLHLERLESDAKVEIVSIRFSCAVEPLNPEADIPFSGSIISIIMNNFLPSLYSPFISLFSNMHVCGFFLLITFD